MALVKLWEVLALVKLWEVMALVKLWEVMALVKLWEVMRSDQSERLRGARQSEVRGGDMEGGSLGIELAGGDDGREARATAQEERSGKHEWTRINLNEESKHKRRIFTHSSPHKLLDAYLFEFQFGSQLFDCQVGVCLGRQDVLI